AYVEGKAEIPFTSVYETFPDKKLRDTYLGGTWTQQLAENHELQIRATYSHNVLTQGWTACFPQLAYLPELYALYTANPAYANSLISGSIPTGGTANDDLLAAKAFAAIKSLGAGAIQPLCALANQDLTES